MNEYIEAMVLGMAGWLSKGLLSYVIDKKIEIRHRTALGILWGLIALGLLPFSKRVTDDPNIQDLIIYRGGLLAPNVISLVEKKLPSILSFLIEKKWH